MKFKTLIYLSGLFIVTSLFMSCGTAFYAPSRGNPSAPGQLKKAYGTPSAKPFAPGQVKKRYGAQSAKHFAPGQNK